MFFQQLFLNVKGLMNNKYRQTHTYMATRHGLVVKAEDSRPRGPGFKPPLWRPFFRHHSFGSKLGTKIVEKL